MNKIIISCEHGTINSIQGQFHKNKYGIIITVNSDSFTIPWTKISCIAHNDILMAYEIRVDISQSDFRFYEAVIDSIRRE